MQTFVSRSDLGCGSTIGPITSSRLGVPTLDVGSPSAGYALLPRDDRVSGPAATQLRVLEAFFNRAGHLAIEVE